MTDPTTLPPSSPVALLDQLDELRAKATPGPWQHEQNWIDMGVPDNSKTLRAADSRALGDVYLYYPDEDNAALIVAAVNAVGPLTAAVRAVLELADSWAALEHWDYKGPEKLARARADSANDAARILREHLAAALSLTP